MEIELRHLLYVALTRMANHLILTVTTDARTARLYDLMLLRPGLDLAGVNFPPSRP